MSKVKEQQAAYAVTKKRMKSGQIHTPKDLSLRLLKRMKQDASFEDIMYELYVLEKMNRGLREIHGGKTVSHAEARRRLRRWLK